MRTEVIEADSIDAAAERILDELKEDADATRSISNRNNVIYFNGWDGLGASAVLRAVAHRLAAAAASDAPLAGLKFDQIIHVDCSKWESKRRLQRLIAEQLELPAELMKMFDKQEDEDDYNGLSQASRLEIPQVLRAMHRRIQDLNRRFLVIFHNGSDQEIDIASFGFPLSQYLDNKVLWTFQGRFRMYPGTKVAGALKKSTAGTKTDIIFLSRTSSYGLEETKAHQLWSVLVSQEAAETVAAPQSEITTNDRPVAAQQAAGGECFFLHMLKLCCISRNLMMDYDLARHACNYWICEQQLLQLQLQQGGEYADAHDHDHDHLWRAADALQREMRLDVDYYCGNDDSSGDFPSQLMRFGKAIMMPNANRTATPYGFLLIPTGAIPNADMFLEDFNKIVVLRLSRRTFSFSSPPFIYCHNLKFLWIDHCQDQDLGSSIDGFPQENENKKIVTEDRAAPMDDFQRCFERLWVLDMRYTRCERILSTRMLGFMTQLRELHLMGVQDWDMGQMQGQLSNIRKLRVTKSTVRCTSCSEEDLFSGMDKMELLDLSGNNTKKDGVTGISTSSNQLLQSVTVAEGCVGIQRLSFRGCAILKNLLLSGLFADLRVLDMSGTAIKTLDLSAMTAKKLDELYLNNCEELCAILWPAEEKRRSYLPKLHIDTTRSAAPALVRSSSSSKEENKSTDGSTSTAGVMKTPTAASLTVAHGARPPSELYWCIVVKDTRLLRSLVPSFGKYFKDHVVHVEISTPSHRPSIDIGGSKNDGVKKGTRRQQQLVMSNSQQEQPDGNALVYGDVAVRISEDHLIQVEAGEGDAPTITRTWPCPPADRLDSDKCYLYTQDQKMKGMDGGTITIPSVICDNARILHVHDSLSITSIPGHARWYSLRWCRVERCPRLNFIFTAPRLAGSNDDNVRIFWYLQTFWASQLPRARFLWDMNSLPASKIDERSFEDLTLLHLEFCPRLIHVLPYSPSVYQRRFLEILEIVWCGNLRTVFPLLGSDDDTERHQEQQHWATEGEIITVYFPNLKHIHLHELPKVQSICGWRGRMLAPNLETVRIRGCWSLRHLPSVSRDRSSKVECDCEKEWWDRLEWDGLKANHHHSMYKPNHSKHYKKTLLRGSVLI